MVNQAGLGVTDQLPLRYNKCVLQPVEFGCDLPTDTGCKDAAQTPGAKQTLQWKRGQFAARAGRQGWESRRCRALTFC